VAETLVEKGICEACGSKVREGSAFCYNCGESVDYEPPPPAILKPDATSLNGADLRDARTVAFKDPEPPPVAIPRGSPDAPREIAQKTEKFPAVSRHRPPRTRVRKQAEVEWVERSSSAVAFIVTAIVLGLLAVLLVTAALYLR
jgi:hypothetical protein